MSRIYRKSNEVDPHGKNPKESGAKLDVGKDPVVRGAFQYFPRAQRAIADLSAIGAMKYTWNGWEDVPDGFNRYSEALGRHLLDEAQNGLYDDGEGGTGVLHATAVAWNAMARLELLIKELGGHDGGGKEV